MGQQVLRVSTKKGANIAKGMIGLFFEDINYAADGGLYAEMIENRSFEFLKSTGPYDKYEQEFDGLYGWTPYPRSGNGAELSIDTEDAVSVDNPHYMRFKSSVSQLGFTNKAYDGVQLKKGMAYHISCYMRTRDEFQENVEVHIYKDGKSKAFGLLAGKVTTKWQKYDAIIEAPEDVLDGEFVIELSLIGTIDVDFVSMIPADAVLGVFRKDLVDLLEEMKPGFIRFPGGCIVEGNNMENRYKWKESVGAIEGRKNNWNRWAVHESKEEDDFVGPYAHYNQTLGLGYYEYFILCEHVGAKPLPVLNVGLGCQFQCTDLVEIESEEFKEYIQDALDLIEFANGDHNTKWGAVRCKMGHKAPFELEMIGIGNEQWETEQSRFLKRYELFENAIHQEYPQMKLIGSAGPDVRGGGYFVAWDFYQDNSNKSNFVYAVDEHYYQPEDWMYNNTHFYDNYPRNIKVFAGEYATHIGPSKFNNTKANTLGAALSEAAFLTGLERNADVVELASYAPILARIGYTQWSPDMIWFDGIKSYGTPSYYVQKMYSLNMGDYVLESSMTGYGQRVHQTVCFDEVTNDIIIKLVNGSDKNYDIILEFDDTFSICEEGKVFVLGAKGSDEVNSIENPHNIDIMEKTLNISQVYNLEACSMSVIRVKVEQC